ncbi:MAG: tryptophan--tRNA ligase [Bacteroidales bacterium]|nr:tryptophan--tRNA ligase [Bacteroidales bacterium]
MQTVVSGIRPTGDLHLGNYFGALRNFVKMQNDYNCYFFVADYHSLTTHPHPDHLQVNVRKILSQYIAAGLDPEKCTLYIQSDIPETAEFYMLMNMNAYIGELERVVVFKEKARQNPDNINAGLLTYAVLMACDILIQKADYVPVGKDQEQHLEMTCKYARRFNNIYGVEYFKEPKAFSFGKDLIKVPGLDGSGKMGKSDNNGIYLIDSDKDIRKKVMKAVTDSGPTEPNSEKPQVIQNLFTFMNLVSEKSTIEHFENAWNDCSIRYGDMKKQLAEDIIKTVAPIRERIQEIEKDTDYLDKVAKMGAEKAHIRATQTVQEVRQIFGFRPVHY